MMRKIEIILFILLFNSLSCFWGVKENDKELCRVEGKVSYRNEPLAGGIVEVYSGAKGGVFLDDKLYASMKIKSNDGRFNISLPYGNYCFILKKREKDNIWKEGDYFCYYGGNPVALFDKKKELALSCIKIFLPQEKSGNNPDKTGLACRVVDVNGEPLKDAYVYLFSVSNPDLRRKAEIVSVATLKDGSVSIESDTTGYYFLVARKRHNIHERGPLKEGDYQGYYYANPINIIRGQYSTVTIECSMKKKEFIPNNPVIIPAGKYGIRGRILDKNGNPLSGLFAFAYKNEFNISRRPDYKSMFTGSDGKFLIIVEREGFYAVGARKTHGGPPEPGDLSGFFSGSSSDKIELNKRVTEVIIDIVVVEDTLR
jgi:uncharacterized GH25 family protein